MKNNVLFKASVIGAAAALSLAAILGGCGKKTASQTGENIVPIEQPQDGTQGDNGNAENAPKYEVKLDERTADTQYSYGEDDISLVDTVSGKKIVLGQTKAEIESVTGEAKETDADYVTYDGVIVRYADDKAVTLLVSNGKFEGNSATRYKTSRGVGLGTTRDDFSKAYGDNVNQGSESTDENGNVEKTASRAVRYFEKDGSDMKFLGTKLTSEQKSKNNDKSNYYIQDFMFSNKDGNIATMRVSLYEAAFGGM